MTAQRECSGESRMRSLRPWTQLLCWDKRWAGLRWQSVLCCAVLFCVTLSLMLICMPFRLCMSVLVP